MESKIGNRTNWQAEKSVSTIVSELKTAGRIENYGDINGDVAVTGIQFDVNSVTLGVGDNSGTLTATFLPENSAGGYYVEVKGKKYPVSKVNEKIEIGRTEITTEGSSNRKIDSVSTTNSSVATVEKVGDDGIKITGVAAGGPVTITVEYSENITTTISVTVKTKYTVTAEVYSGDTAKGSVSISPSSADNKYAEGSTVTLTATANTGYQLESWYNGATKLSEASQYEYTVPASNVTITAKFKEKRIYGAQVQLNGGNAIAVKGNITIDDNWKLFYIDDDDNNSSTSEYVHLIYGDYYSVDVQTDPDTGSTNTINLTTLSYLWGINSEYPRLNLLKYLKNNSSYAETNLDTSTSTGSYESWINLASTLTETGKALNGKTILVQGAPNITMWKNSWNEQGYAELVLNCSGNTATGYKIEKKVASGTQSYSDYVNLSSDIGYNDTLYFPYKNTTTGNGNSDKALAYWLASAAGSSADYMCYVYSGGGVGCDATYAGWGNSARPVVSILKSDFQTLFPSVSIIK